MNERTPRFRLPAPALAAALMALVAAAACNRGDQIAPDGATINLGANPTNIVCLKDSGGNTTCATADVIATVSSAVGVPLPDQDVRFSSSAGSLLFPGTSTSAANIPIATDQFGNAHVTLATTTTTTVTARSGKASGTLTLNTVQGNLNRITLNFDTTTAGCSTLAPDVSTCTDRICLVAQALDDNNVGVPNLVIQFTLSNATGTNSFSGNFSPVQPSTDASGVAHTALTPGNTCSTDCAGNKCATVDVTASTQGGLQSSPVTLNINIP